VLRFLVAATNLIFSPVLKGRKHSGNPLISVLIPARNEEKNIPVILKDLKKQGYQNIEVIVFNDQSTDRTAEIVSQVTATDQRFRLINSEGLPKGWLGKNHACHQLALHASGDYLLYLDADVRIKPGIIESALAQIQKHRLKLLTIFPKQIMITTGEKIVVPIMNSILLSLLPLILTRLSVRPSLAAGNGQFMFFEKNSYFELLPHEKVKQNPTEDILIARLYKKRRRKMQCMTGNETISCRMYSGLHDAIAGFSRSLPHFFGGSHFVAFLYWLITTFGIFIVAFYLPFVYFIVALILIINTKTAISISSRQPLIQNMLWGIVQQLFMGVIVIRSYNNKVLKKSQWKGRNIDS
jgi:glycosyltransferase involved in cell wall biosynthesis